MSRPFKRLRYGIIAAGLVLLLSSCKTLLGFLPSTLRSPDVLQSEDLQSAIVQPFKLAPPKFELKPVNAQGGYFCSNGSTAFGPISQRMIQKCQGWGGGASCNQTHWSEAFFVKAYGSGGCPEGSRLNQFTGFCTEGKTVLGPFPKNLVTACEEFGGGAACHSQRWTTRLFNRLARSQGMIPTDSTKPPQFVMLAFDGSSSLKAWNRSRTFAKEMDAKGKPTKFTYFISAVYFIHRDHRKLYDAPGGKGKGRSAIGWADSRDEIQQRLDHLNQAHQEGHEIAGHAVGHFNGNSWSETDWADEFKYFDQFIFDSHEINGLPGSLIFDRNTIEGFRAPELGKSPGLYKTLQKENFRYDTSKVARANYWPQQENGVWNFPLASLKTALTRKNTLSMDYNFYMAHSRARPNPGNAKRYAEDTFQTYMQYFKSNYNGNRAPIHIGHHFSEWNGGAYWDAMFRFAEAVCGQPEVLCVTYRDLADYMDLLTPEQIAAYQKGDFSNPTFKSPSGTLKTQPMGLKLTSETQQICQPS
ncbi:MAG: hypothetical protein ACFBSC_13295 [Microcoleaceae cyanobacterium]